MEVAKLALGDDRGIITEELVRNMTAREDEDANSNLIVAKVTTMLVLGLVSFLLGLLPIKLAKWFDWKFHNSDRDGNNRVISLLLCFGGGVLMFTTFLHLQPEVREGMQRLIDNGQIPEYASDVNLAELVFCMGFFFVYLIEEVVHGILDRKHHHHEDEAFLHRTMSLRQCSRQPKDETNPTLIPRVSLNQNCQTSTTSTSTQVLYDNTSVSTIETANTTRSTIVEPELSTKISALDPEVQMTGGKYFTSIAKSHHSHSHIPYEEDSHSSSSNASSSNSSNNLGRSFRGFCTILALSFHAVFEGLAVGLEMSVSNVWYLFLAVATHKFVISFCVGVELLSTRTKMLLMVVYLATFAIVSPIGIGIGLALSGNPSVAGGDATTIILQGMAAGTLLYVVFFEVLQRERANSQSGVLQLVAIMAGFGVMFALQIITGHSHNHEHAHVAELATTMPHDHRDHHHHHH